MLIKVVPTQGLHMFEKDGGVLVYDLTLYLPIMANLEQEALMKLKHRNA